MEECENRLDMSGDELATLALSLALCFSEKYSRKDVHKLRLFFQTIASNLCIIETEGCRKDCRK